MDPAYVDTARVGTDTEWYARVDVYRDDWDRILKVFEDVASRDLTRRRLSLGTRDSTTGWYTKSFTEDTHEGVLIPKASSHLALRIGTYVRTDALLLTADCFEEGDEEKDAFEKYWEVKAVREVANGDSFSHRECDLARLPLHELV